MGGMIRCFLGFVMSTQCLGYPEIVLIAICFILLRRINMGTTDPKLPSVLRSWPVVGMLPSMLSNTHRIHDWSTEVLQRAGGTMFFKGPWFAGMDLLATANPANVRYVTSTARAADYPKGRDYAEMFDILGNGILNADSDSWRVQRRWAHLLMRQKRFRRQVERTGREKVEAGLVPVLDRAAAEDRVVDLQDIMQRFTFDTTCAFVCGVDPGCLLSVDDVPFARAVDDAKGVIHLRHTVPRSWWKLLRWLRLGNEKTMAVATGIADRCIAEFISTRRREFDQIKVVRSAADLDDDDDDKGAGVDLLTSYMYYEADPEMERMKSSDKRFLRDMVLNMLVAGRDTTSAALTWFFWELSKNPRVEAKILDELRLLTETTLPATSSSDDIIIDPAPASLIRVFAAEELGNLVYLHAALNECLRLYPPVPIIHKCATADDIFPSGHRIRPGLKIYYCLYAMARMESVWGEDCREFKPERWISADGTSLRTDLSDNFFTFNAGPRSCLGKGVSFTHMKMAAASVLYNFQVQVLPDQLICPKISVILHTESGLKVKVIRRRRRVL